MAIQMKNFVYKIFLKQTAIANYARFILLAVTMLGLFGTLVTSQTGGAAGASSAICQVFNAVRNIIFLLGLTLMILGAALYAGANIMPASQRGGFQGYGMAMIIGGVVGVAIAIAAPFVLGLLISSGGANQVLGNTSSTALCGGVGG
jgi:hypothetical protein